MGSDTFKPGWTRVVFGDVVRLGAARVSDPEAAGFARYVGLEHLDPGDLTIRRWGNVAAGTTFTSVFRPGHVLFGKRRAYQRKVAVPDFSGVCSGDIYVFESTNEHHLLPNFLPFICQTDGFFEHAIGTSAGSLSPRTNWKSLAVYEFALPPLAEQLGIAEVVTLAGALSEALRNLLDAAVTMHAGVLSSLESSSECKPVRLGSLLSAIVPGRSVAGLDTPPAASEYGVLKVSAVDPHGFLAYESKTLLDQQDFVSEFSVRSGDLIMTRANTPELVGEVCLVDHEYPNLMLCDKTLRLVPRSNIDPYLLSETLQSRSVRQQLKSVATGTGRSMKNISQAKIGELLIAYPLDENATMTTNERLLRCREAIRNARDRYDKSRVLAKAVIEILLRPVQSQ